MKDMAPMLYSVRISTDLQRTSFSSTAVDPASTSPNLLAPFGEFAATMFRVSLRPLYCHLAASLFLCLLFLLVPCCHGFIVRPACVIQGHFANSFM
jgi:hypothetical protein